MVSAATGGGTDQQDFLSDISQREFSTLSPKYLMENGKRTVILTHVNDAGDFYVAIKEARMDAAFDAMQSGLNQHFSSLADGDGQNKETLWVPRAPVVALFEEKWYRARVIGTQSTEIFVFFVDYGNQEQVMLILSPQTRSFGTRPFGSLRTVDVHGVYQIDWQVLLAC